MQFIFNNANKLYIYDEVAPRQMLFLLSYAPLGIVASAKMTDFFVLGLFHNTVKVFHLTYVKEK